MVVQWVWGTGDVCLRDAETETLGETGEEMWPGTLGSSRVAGIAALVTLPEHISEKSESVREGQDSGKVI